MVISTLCCPSNKAILQVVETEHIVTIAVTNMAIFGQLQKSLKAIGFLSSI
jgi:hypothetical protein